MSISNWRLHPTFGISDIQSVAEQRNQTEKNVDAMRLIRKKYTKLGLCVDCAEWMCAERWFIWLDWVFATMKYCLILFRLVSTTWRWWLIAVISYNDDSLCDGATFCLHSIPLHTKMHVLQPTENPTSRDTKTGKRSISWKWCKIYKNSHKGLQNVEREKKNVAHFVVVRSRKSVSGQLKIKECSFFSCIRPNINILLLLFLFCIVIFEPIALCRFLVRHNSGIWSHK